MWLILILASYCFACSDFQLRCQDGSIICGRAMDFIMPMKSQILVFNRGMNMSSKAPDGSTGLQWISKYGFVGINAYGIDLVDEGLNQVGLSCGILVLDGSEYPPIVEGQDNISIAIMDVCTWILGMFSNKDDVIEGIMSVRIWGNVMPPPIKIVMGLHIAIHDALGNNLVIEFLDGDIQYDSNPLGVLTNEPPLFYHLQNLGLYTGLSPYNPPNEIINGYKVQSSGSGMKGIPGSWSPIDRFVRIATMVRYLNNLKTAMDGVLAATHILNSVYVPSGIAIASFKGYHLVDTTRWATMKDLTNLIFYYRISDGAIRSINLKNIDFNGVHKSYPVQQPPVIIDETGNL